MKLGRRTLGNVIMTFGQSMNDITKRQYDKVRITLLRSTIRTFEQSMHYRYKDINATSFGQSTKCH